jgi:uncharacterized membrane protein YbhN (UPF0104 family)
LARAVERVDPVWLASCFLAQVGAYAGYVLAVWGFARTDGGPRLSLPVSARTVCAGFGVYAAAHAAGGFAVDFWAFRRAGLPRREAIARVLGLGVLEYCILASAAFVCSVLLLLGEGGRVQDAMTLPWLTVVPGFVVALWISGPRRVAAIRSRAARGSRLWGGVAHAVAGVVTLRRLAGDPLRNCAPVLGVAAYFAGDVACLWAALQMVSADLSIEALVVAYASAYAITRRSLPAGGAGFVEVLLTFCLVWVGVPLAPAILAVLVYRLFNFWLPILPALAILPAVRELRHDFLAAERALDAAA